MLKNLAALLIVFGLAGEILAGEFACDKSANLGAAEMACCEQAKSATSSAVATLCCQTVCGEEISGPLGLQSEARTSQHQVPAPAIVAHTVILSGPLFAGSNFSKSVGALLDPSPPALYLHNSALLI